MVLIYINHKISEFKSNKGRGFISNQVIKPNEIILIEKPDISLSQYTESPLFETLYQLIIKSKLDEFNKLVPYQIDYLETQLLLECDNLLNSTIKKTMNKFSKLELSLLISKYKQNVFNMDNTKKKIKPCVLFWGSIFNHSCVPNVNFKYEPKEKVMIFYANVRFN